MADNGKTVDNCQATWTRSEASLGKACLKSFKSIFESTFSKRKGSMEDFESGITTTIGILRLMAAYVKRIIFESAENEVEETKMTKIRVRFRDLRLSSSKGCASAICFFIPLLLMALFAKRDSVEFKPQNKIMLERNQVAAPKITRQTPIKMTTAKNTPIVTPAISPALLLFSFFVVALGDDCGESVLVIGKKDGCLVGTLVTPTVVVVVGLVDVLVNVGIAVVTVV